MSRVRNGTGKVEKLVAQGVAPPSAAVIGELELQKWNTLLDQQQEKKQEEAHHLRTQKHQMSQVRKKGWINTVEGAHALKEEKHRKRGEEEEQRRRLIDVEEAEIRVVERRAVVDDANRQLHARDPRVVALNSQLLFHEVLQEREEQLVLSARKKQQTKEREHAYAQTIIRAAEQETLENKEKALIARQNLVMLSQDRLGQLQEQKKQRAEEHYSARREQQRLREVGDQAANDEVEMKLSARVKAREVALAHKLQLQEKSARTPRRTEGVAGPVDTELEERNLNYAVKKAVQNQIYQECLSARAQRKDQARQIALEAYVSPTAQKDNSVSTIVSGRSMESRVHEEDVLRSNMKEKQRHQAAMLNSQLGGNTARKERQRQLLQHQTAGGGQGGGGGVTNADPSPQMTSPSQQERIRRQVAQQEEEELELKMAAKQDAKKLQHFHQLQANQKKVNDLAHDEELRVDGRELRTLVEEEDYMFSNYVQSMMPSEMNYKLKQNAAKPPKPLRAS